MTQLLVAGGERIPPQVQAWLPLPWCEATWVGLGSAGGLSGARFWLATLGEERWGLRRWPREHPSRERLAAIHRWLRAATPLLFLPQPVAGRDGQTWCETKEGLWELTAWKRGVSIASLSADDGRLGEAMRGIAALHRIWACESQGGSRWSPAVQDRAERLRALATGELDELEGRASRESNLPLREVGREGCRVLRESLSTLRSRIEAVPSNGDLLQPCVRDLRPEHVLFEGEQLSGVVDFGAARIDTIATDLARLLGGWFEDDHGGWQAARAAYESERAVPEQVWRTARVLEVTGAGISIANWLRWLWIERREFEDLEAISVRLRGFIRRLSRLGGIEWSR